VKDGTNKTGEVVPSEGAAYRLSNLFSGERIDVWRDLRDVFDLVDFGVGHWGTRCSVEHRQHALLGPFAADPRERQEGTERVQEVLIERVPRDVRPQPLDPSRVAKVWA
jgi:hypothetical protein